MTLTSSGITLDIECMAHGAHAVAHLDDGLVVFVENACPGDKVQAHIYDHRRSFAYAEIDELTKASDLRMLNPPCKLHKICGGCQWQHINYEEQLEFKRQNVIDFIRKAEIKSTLPLHMLVAPVIAMEDPWRYRNKITYPVETVESSQRLLAGYYKRNTHELVNVKYCPVQYEVFDAIIEDVKELCSQKYISKPLLRHINLRANHDQSEVLLTLIVRERELARPENSAVKVRLEECFDILMTKYPQLKGCCLNYNDGSTNVIFGERTIVVRGQGLIEDKLGNLRFKISPNSFFQINNSQFHKIMEVIRGQVQSLIDSEEMSATGAEVLDAYAGIGTIALSLAASYPLMQITAIEQVDAAVRNGIANAELNKINSVEFKTGDVEEHIEEFVARAQFRSDKTTLDLVVLNPPRKGCTNKVLDALGKIAPPHIIYVSCNPVTLSRDIKELEKFGYEVQTIQPVDMFPHTYHVETVARLKRVS